MDIRYPTVDLTGVKGVLIDIDNTLFSYNLAHEAAMRATYKAESLGVDFNDYLDLYYKVRDIIIARLEPQPSARSRILSFQMMAEHRKADLAYVRGFKMAEIYWDCFIDAMTPAPSAEIFLKRCAAAAVPVCAVTDMLARIQVRKVEKLGFSKYIAYMVSSEEVGVEKPDPRIFLEGLKKINVPPHQAIMLGDNAEKDIAGAAGVFVKGYLLHPEVVERKQF